MTANMTGPRFNHMQLVDAVTSRTEGIAREDVAAVLRATFDVIGTVMANRGTVSVTNFGRFSTYTRGVRNPRTGETGLTATIARWNASGKLKEAIRTGVVPETFKKAGHPARLAPGPDEV